MSDIKIFVEGGGDKERCRAAFRKLLESSGFKGRVPRIVASGSRNEAFSDFETALSEGKLFYVGLIVDSEDPVADGEKPWDHLIQRDGWARPTNAADDQVFLMTTCMETWIVADRAALKKHYRNGLQENSLPPLDDLESKSRHDLYDKLAHSTRACTKAYKKGKRSFEVLELLNPDTLKAVLPAFARMVRILDEKL